MSNLVWSRDLGEAFNAGKLGDMKPSSSSSAITLGLGAPFLLFGLAILGLSLVDVYAQTLGVGTE